MCPFVVAIMIVLAVLLFALALVGIFMFVVTMMQSGGRVILDCDGCNNPMPEGYTAYECDGDEVRLYCERCATKRGLMPWDNEGIE